MDYRPFQSNTYRTSDRLDKCRFEHRVVIVHVDCRAAWLKHQGTAFGQQKSTFLTVLEQYEFCSDFGKFVQESEHLQQD
jgi:hypothetical protein